MTYPKTDLNKIRAGLKSKRTGRLLLKALSCVYWIIINIRKAFYRLGFFKTRSLSAPVICFGNISTGGTGKTSTVAAVALELKQSGKKPAILMRGYKRTAPAKTLTELAGPGPFDPAEAGDEAFMLYNLVKAAGIPVMVCADRFKAGESAINNHGCDILLMDDGLQHFALRRDLDVILINATAPFHKDFLLPFGDLRESAMALKRAGAVIISHCEHASPGGLEELSAQIKKINPGAAVIASAHEPAFFINASTTETLAPKVFAGREAVALSGIGDPESFEGTLRDLKITLKQTWRYPDHHNFTRDEFTALENTSGGNSVITTYKDFSRFPPGWRELFTNGIYLLSVKIIFLRGDYSVLMNTVNSVLARKSGTN
ncbi:MAG TPA: tetraacyldisaccharide 4'-kinase [Elusimicrobia bacterium]|nr:tetraacyldisaccharide 4'-kinase [Elusimicrobiota bacterium]